MYRNILKEYSDIINTADFTTHFKEITEVTNEKQCSDYHAESDSGSNA